MNNFYAEFNRHQDINIHLQKRFDCLNISGPDPDPKNSYSFGEQTSSRCRLTDDAIRKLLLVAIRIEKGYTVCGSV